MIRLGTLLWALLVGVSGYIMFQVKYQVVRLEDELVRVDRLIDADREQIRVLDAEWSFLNQPARLAELAKRHLALSPITPIEVTRLDQLPWRSPTPPAAAAPAAPPSASSQPTAAPRSPLSGGSR